MNRIQKADDFAMWASLPVYYITWILFSWSLGGREWIPVGIILGGFYVFGHVLEIRTRGKCYLYADPSALPLVVLCSLTAYVIISSRILLPGNTWKILLGIFSGSWFAGHLQPYFFQYC